MGTFQSNDQAIAHVEMMENTPFIIDDQDFVIALDSIQDPGNLGTIIRTADWFGIDKILLSNETVDMYNPKVISGTKGSFTRVKLHYCDLAGYLSHSRVKVIGASTKGKNLSEYMIKPPAVIVLGSESQGISPDLIKYLSGTVTIPKFGNAESLNVAIANAIICHYLATSASD
jgi:TrmH family RNA methyltransferase